jgi:hypothetical protein
MRSQSQTPLTHSKASIKSTSKRRFPLDHEILSHTVSDYSFKLQLSIKFHVNKKIIFNTHTSKQTIDPLKTNLVLQGLDIFILTKTKNSNKTGIM